MIKTLKNLLWNQKADDLETWYVALGTQVLPNFSNDYPELTLTYFTASQIWSLMLLYWIKVKRWTFSETIVNYDIKVGRCSQPNEHMKLYEYQVKVIH